MNIEIPRQDVDIPTNDLINAVESFIREKRFLTSCLIRDGRKIRIERVDVLNINETDVGPATEEEKLAFEVLMYLEEMKYLI